MPQQEFPEELTDRFAPEARLGAGAYGVVFRARDQELKRPVAVKVFPSTLTQPERFLREATRLATLRHESLVPIYLAGRTADAYYLVMELVEGEPLSAWARPGERDPLAVLLDVAGALEEVHRAGLVHRDVKPGNIQVGAGDRGVLLDLGCVYDATGATLTRTGTILGTANYLPPEAFRGSPPSPSWDWYSWGATLMACLEGVTPYEVAGLMEYGQGGTLPALRLGAATRRAGLEKLLRACLAVDDRARPASREELEALAGPRARPSSTGASRPRTTKPLPRPGPGPDRRSPAAPASPRRWWGPPLALALLGLAILGWATSDPAPPPPPAPPAAPPPPAVRAVDWARERGGPLPLPSPGVAPQARVAAPCGAQDGEAVVATGELWAHPGGGLYTQLGGTLVVYGEDPLRVRALAMPARAVRLLPGPEGALWALHPGDLEVLGTPPTWQPERSTRDAAGCLKEIRVAGDPQDPLAWQVAEALLPPTQGLRMLPQRAGGYWVHDVGPDRGGAPRRLLLGRHQQAPRVHAFPEEAGWKVASPPTWDPLAQAVVLSHRHPQRGTRVRAVLPETGATAWERRWPGRQDWGPAVSRQGLYLFDGEGVRRATRDDGEDLGIQRLADDPGWIPAHEDQGVRLLADDDAVHVFVPHRILPGRAHEEVPALSWYRLAPDLSGPTPPRPWRLKLPRPAEAVWVESRSKVAVRRLPGYPDRALLAVQLAWSRYELLVVDLGRPRVLRRLDVSPGDELTDSGYLRTDPVVTERNGGLRVAWVDLWGVLKTWDM